MRLCSRRLGKLWPSLSPDGSVEVEYEYGTPVQGFGLSVPAGSVEVIRGVSGVQSAYYVHANRLW